MLAFTSIYSVSNMKVNNRKWRFSVCGKANQKKCDYFPRETNNIWLHLTFRRSLSMKWIANIVIWHIICNVSGIIISIEKYKYGTKRNLTYHLYFLPFFSFLFPFIFFVHFRCGCSSHRSVIFIHSAPYNKYIKWYLSFDVHAISKKHKKQESKK